MKLSAVYVKSAFGAFALAAVFAFASASEITIPSVKKSGVIRFKTPVSPDSIDKDVNSFTSTDLMKSIVPEKSSFFRDESQDWTTIRPDTAGYFKLELGKADDTARNEVSIQKLAATLRPDSYFNGTLKIKTPFAATLYVNGEKRGEKISRDSVAGELKETLHLQPHRDVLIEVHLLSDNNSTDGSSDVALMLEPTEDSKDVTVSYNPEKGVFDIMSTVIAPRVASVKLSPDGKYMIVATSETTDGKNYTYSYDIRQCADGKVTSMNVSDGLSWMKGKSSVLLRNRDNADGSFDIEAIDYPSMRVSVIASRLPAEAKDYYMSPSGDYLIFEKRVEGEKPSGTMRRVLNPDDRMPGNRDRSYLSMIWFEEGLIRPLTYGGPSSSLASISGDGKKILYISSRETPAQYPFYDMSLIQLDVNTLQCDTLLRHEPSLMTATYSPDGKRVFVTAGPSFYNGLGADCGNHPIPNDYDIQGYIYDIPSRQVKAVTREFDPSIYGNPVWNKADDSIYFMAQAGFDMKVFRLNPNDGKIKELPVKLDYVRNFSIGNEESRYMAYTGMCYNDMGKAYMLDLKTGRSTLIADPASGLIATTDFGKSDMWSFTAPDGTLIEGTVTLPPNFDPSRKYPLIVYYYAGTTPTTHTNHSPYSPPLFASYGYVVYAINPSGSIGYGQEYSARHVNAWGERTADEIIYGTQEFCRSHPYVDNTKIGCIGASYGGFMTQLLTTKTDIFAAAVSHAGISNVTSYWGEGYWGYSYNSVAAAKSYPWSNPEVFTRNSSLFNADKIHTPLLLLHGTVDTNVPIGESIQLFNALKILGRDVEFITVEGENHIVMDFQKRKEWHATIMAWFEKWLKGDDRWWKSIYGEK